MNVIGSYGAGDSDQVRNCPGCGVVTGSRPNLVGLEDTVVLRRGNSFGMVFDRYNLGCRMPFENVRFFLGGDGKVGARRTPRIYTSDHV